LTAHSLLRLEADAEERQKAASFTIDQAMEKPEAAMTAHR
jgi:hypothetical protein